jgi:hypothetical protein
MTPKQKAAELKDTREMIKRHQLERQQLEHNQTEARQDLEKRLETEKRALEHEHVRQSLELRVKYGHEIGRGAAAILGDHNARCG